MQGQDGDLDLDDLNLDDESMGIDRRDRGQSMNDASQSAINFGDDEEANGGQEDIDFSDMAELLGLENLDRLTYALADANSNHKEAIMDLVVEAITEASQAHNGAFGFRRGHAPSGFDLESNKESIAAFLESNGQRNQGDEDEEYVPPSEYEVDPEDINLLNEQCGAASDDRIDLKEIDSPSNLARI